MKKEYLEEIEGDMEEVFQEGLERFSAKKAKWIYGWETLKLLRSKLVKDLEGTIQLNQYGMFKNHFKTAIRAFKREKSFTFINVLGLSLGICCTLLIGLWVLDEFSYDTFHTNSKRLYQIKRNAQLEGGKLSTAEGTAYPIGDELVKQFPEIVDRTRFTQSEKIAFDFSGQLIEIGLSAADPNFFQSFTFPLINGDAQKCLSELSNIVISENLAVSHFDGKNPLGETVTLLYGDESFDFIVSGVFEKVPDNSTLRFDAVIHIDNYLPFNTYYHHWGNSWLTTYVLLNKNAKPEEVNNKIEDFPKKVANVDWFTLLLQPFEDQYLFSKFENGKVAGGRIDNVILFSIIAIFTLLIACFNFINLTTARSGKRSKEVGIKKVMGAGKGTLISQFVFESVLLVFISVILGVLLTQLSLPNFNEIATKSLSIDYFDVSLYMALAAIGLATVLFSGVYPAIFLSSFHAISALKGKLKGNFGQAFLRKGLVIFQFSLSMILVAGTIVVFLQLNYVQNMELGIEKENIIHMPLDVKTREHYEAVKAELAQNSSMSQVSSSNDGLTGSWRAVTSDPVWEGKSPDAGQLWFSVMDVDYGMLEILGIKLLEGRHFSEEYANEDLNFIINEEAAKIMGLNEPIGKTLHFWDENQGKIVGLAKDFHYRSLHIPIDPLIIRCKPANTQSVYIKTVAGQTNEAIEALQTVHEEFSSLPFEYHFLDQTIEDGYKEEKKIQRIAGGFSALAIFISCLGLLGLASFTASQRTKEIAVRKVLGARILNLISLLFKEYFKLIVISAFIAVPVAYYWTSQWLESFTFRIEQSWWIYTLPGIIVLLIAMLTIGRLSFKTANTNPADSLRDE